MRVNDHAALAYFLLKIMRNCNAIKSFFIRMLRPDINPLTYIRVQSAVKRSTAILRKISKVHR